MPVLSYGRAWSELAGREPDADAIVFAPHQGPERLHTRGQLERRANRLARAYAARGVGEGDLVTLALPNCPEFFEVCLAVWKLGATPQPVSHRLPERERRAIVELARPSLLVGPPAGEAYPGVAVVPAGFEPDPSLADAPLPDVTPRCARAMTSGGSTGRPKVIIDTVAGECDPDQPGNRVKAGGTTLVPGPLYHAGPFMTSWSQLFGGGRIVLLDRFDAERALALIERHRVDWVLFVPTMMQRIWRLPEAVRSRYDVSSIETVMCTGAPSPPWLKRAWIGWLGPSRIFEAYGGTERIAGTMIDGTEWLAHPGSVGRPTLGRRIRVLDADGKDLPPGEIGEVYMMPPGGRGSTYRYLGAEAPVTADGWETLGDMGWLDEEGFLYLVDRKSDMILSGGANVYPAEVEAALDAHPAVRSSVVVGLPDGDLGQRVHAIVDAPGGVGEEALRAHLAEHLVRYKIPRTFEFASEPLRDDAGKVRRSAFRKERLAETPTRSRGGIMALSPRELSDRIEIQDLLTRYTVALDQKDWKKLDTCFTPDADVDYTSTGGTKGRWPEVRQWLEKALSPFPMTMHFISNTTVELDGDRAHTRTYVINPMGFQNPDGSLHLFTVGAIYDDDLVRTADGWRIARRLEEHAFMDGSLPEALQIPT